MDRVEKVVAVNVCRVVVDSGAKIERAKIFIKIFARF